MLHFYTSINCNYLPKARVLAETVKKWCPKSKFSLLYVDEFSSDIEASHEYFDEILQIEDLHIPVDNLNLWIFQHTVVELCTAIKGQALVKFLEGGSENVVYLDPDIAVFDDLTCIEKLLEVHDIILTPHQTIPETKREDILNNEICSLQHGIYNFGFYAVKSSKNGLEFAHWWRDRLVDFCFDDIPHGLFTDQRWGDFAPALFDGVYIWRDPGCNVSTWNLTKRKVTKENGTYYVNGSKLKFYHFSGFDSGAQKIMLDKYGDKNPYLYELRDWYCKAIEDKGQKSLGIGNMKSMYNYYSNGVEIKPQDRKFLREHVDVQKWFAEANPFDVNQRKSYYSWVKYENTCLGKIYRFGIAVWRKLKVCVKVLLGKK